MLGLQVGDKISIPVYKHQGRGRSFLRYKECIIVQITNRFYVVDLGTYKITFSYNQEAAIYTDS